MMPPTLLTGRLRAALLAVTVCVLSLAFAWSAVRASDTTDTYLVRYGDTLASIAAGHSLTVKGLLALNPEAAEAEAVYVGQTLQVPRDSDPGPAPPVVCPLEIEVRAGDTLASIAAAHGIPAGTLALVNRLDPAAVPAAGTRLCVPALPEPAARIACEDAPQYVLQRTPPVTLINASRAFPGGHQVCVETTWSVGGTERHWVRTEDGLSGWMRGADVGTWQAYLASRNAPQPPPTPTATRRPTRTPTPTPTAAACRDAWGASAVAYRVRTGPGTSHAHTGKYVAAGQAVCELGRDQGWVQVRLADGTTGWVHGDGITNRRPAPTPTATPVRSVAVAPTAFPQAPKELVPSTAVGVTVMYEYTIDIPPGWAKADWSNKADARWEGDKGVLWVRTYRQPVATTLDQFAHTVRDAVRLDDWWQEATLFEITAFGKHRVDNQDFYRLKYRVGWGGDFILDVEEIIGLGSNQIGPSLGLRVQHRMGEGAGFEQARRQLLDSFRIVEVPPYYTQGFEVKGILIKAGSKVAPKALQVVGDTIEFMLAPGSRSDIPGCLKRAGVSIAIIPWDEKITSLPEFGHFKGEKHSYDGTPMEDNRGLFHGKHDPITVTNEENVLDLPSNYLPGSDVTVHELAHAIHEVCFTPEEQSRWEALYEEAKAARLFPLDLYLMVHNNREFFAMLSTFYFNRATEKELRQHGISGGREALRRKLDAAGFSEVFTILEGIYGAR